MDEKQKADRAVMRSSLIYDKTRPKGQQSVARIQGAVADDGAAIVMFGCQRADEDGKVCWLSKQHAIEFAASMMMIALSLPGDVSSGDMSMASEDWPAEPVSTEGKS